MKTIKLLIGIALTLVLTYLISDYVYSLHQHNSLIRFVDVYFVVMIQLTTIFVVIVIKAWNEI